jgi:hypothetical protein
MYLFACFLKKSITFCPLVSSTMNSRFKEDLNLQIDLHKAFFPDNRFLDFYVMNLKTGHPKKALCR